MLASSRCPSPVVGHLYRCSSPTVKEGPSLDSSPVPFWSTHLSPTMFHFPWPL